MAEQEAKDTLQNITFNKRAGKDVAAMCGIILQSRTTTVFNLLVQEELQRKMVGARV